MGRGGDEEFQRGWKERVKSGGKGGGEAGARRTSERGRVGGTCLWRGRGMIRREGVRSRGSG